MIDSEDRELINKALFVPCVLAIVGLLLVVFFRFVGLNEAVPGHPTIYYWLFARYEPIQLVIVLAAALTLGIAANRGVFPSWAKRGGAALLDSGGAAKIVAFGAVWCFLAGWLGRHWLLHNFLFSMDEFNAAFQAKILLSGEIFAKLPDRWLEFRPALQMVFVVFNPDRGAWTPFYEPLYAALLAPFLRAGLDGLLNPLLAAGGVYAAAAVVRKVWPEHRSNGNLAVILLVVSPQFIVMGMTGYSYPAHLLLNLVWLRLYLRKSGWAIIALPWVGFVAMGLHQFVPHALFAVPFLFRILLDRDWKRCGYTAAVYLFAGAFWLQYMSNIFPLAETTAEHLRLPDGVSLVDQACALALILTWQPLALIVLAILGLSQWKSLPAVARDAAWSILITFCFYFFLRLNQGHGWGFRYIYPAIGNFVVLAIPGWHYLRRIIGREPAAAFVALSAALALLVQFPLRAYEIWGVTKPFAETGRQIAALSDSIVVIDSDSVWYGLDLVRNDPFLRNKPKTMHLGRLTEEQLKRLRAMEGVKFVGREELQRWGMYAAEAPPGVEDEAKRVE